MGRKKTVYHCVKKRKRNNSAALKKATEARMRNRAIALKEGSTSGMDAEAGTSEELDSIIEIVKEPVTLDPGLDESMEPSDSKQYSAESENEIKVFCPKCGTEVSHTAEGIQELPNSMENFMEYHVMGSVSQIRMKPGCMPTKFECQSNRRKRTSDKERPFIVKKTKTDIIRRNYKRFRREKHYYKTLGTWRDIIWKSRRKQWLEIINRPDLDKPVLKPKSFVVCSKHFDKSSIIFTPKLKSDATPTRCAQEVQDRTKILIAKVYHYFEQEYEELKTIYGDLTPLSKFLQRTALATGVSETTILEVLKEEEGRNANKREETPEKRRRARKRPIQTESSSLEDNPDDNTDAGQESNSFDEAQTLVVKIEPEDYNDEPEIYVPAAVKEELIDIEFNIEQPQTDPIAINERTVPCSDVLDNTNEKLALTEPAATKCKGIKIPTWDVTSTSTNETVALTEQAATKRKGRKTPRSDVTSTRQHTQAESSTTAAWSSVGGTEDLDKDTVMKTEEIGIHEEGPKVGGPWKATLL